MKKLFAAFGFIALTYLPQGCATYVTDQKDISYEKTNIVRSISTQVKTRTFFAAKSEVTKSSVSNSDKLQTSKVGSVTQQATNNLEQVVRIVIEKAP